VDRVLLSSDQDAVELPRPVEERRDMAHMRHHQLS
jgi:hypothetical protein